MRFLLVIVTLLLWIVIILLTSVDNLAIDGANIYGYPRPFVTIYNDEFTGKDVVTWNNLGIFLNVLLFIFIFMVLNELRKKILARNKLSQKSDVNTDPSHPDDTIPNPKNTTTKTT
jgi:hypothetical protein